MQRRGVHLYQCPGRGTEGLDLGGVQLAVFVDVVHLCQQQDEVLGAQVEFGIPVIFQAVELCVVAVAPAQLDGHTAIEIFADLHRRRQILQQRL